MPTLFIVLFITALLPYVLAGIAGYLRYQQFSRFDNHYPRQQQAQLTGMGARAVAAQKNAWEALIFYTSMCVLAYVSEVDIYMLTYPAVLFLLSRIAHAVFYLLDMSTYRSLSFFVGWGCCLDIGYQALTMI